MLVDREGNVDRLSMLGLCLCVVSVALYHFVVYSHFRTYVDYQLQILSLRVAMIIPIYSILTALMLIQPAYAYYFEAVAVLCEAYAIYCYFALIVMYCGGKERVYDLIKNSQHTQPCWASCQQNTPKQCFQTINVLLLQFIFVRPIFVLLHGVVPNHNLGSLFRLLSVVSLVIGMLGLLRIYHILAEHAKKMEATAKIVFIKILIVFLAIEDLAINAIFESGALDNAKSYGDYTREEKEIRLYAIIVLAEFVLASILAVKFFHPARIGYEGNEPIGTTDHLDGGRTALHYSSSGSQDIDTSNLSYSSYIKDLLQVRFVFTHPPGFGKLMTKGMSQEEVPRETNGGFPL